MFFIFLNLSEKTDETHETIAGSVSRIFYADCRLM
jgi:hypothetical protein